MPARRKLGEEAAREIVTPSWVALLKVVGRGTPLARTTLLAVNPVPLTEMSAEIPVGTTQAVGPGQADPVPTTVMLAIVRGAAPTETYPHLVIVLDGAPALDTVSATV